MRVRFNQACNDFDKDEEVECTPDEIRQIRPECYTVLVEDRQETGDMNDVPTKGDVKGAAVPEDAPSPGNDDKDASDTTREPPRASKTTTATRAGRTTAVK